MTPQEKELISSLMGRLKKVGSEPKDAEAEVLIRQAMEEQPDAPYQLVQTVLIQDMALNQAQSRIADLERQLAGAKARMQPASSFLGGLAAGTGAAMPPFGPWGQPVPQPANQPGHDPVGGYARPDYAPLPLLSPMAASCGRRRPRRPASPAARCCSKASSRCSAVTPTASSAVSPSSRR